MVVMINDISSVNRGIDFRNELESFNGGSSKERHKAQVDSVLCFECIFILASNFHDCTHIHFIEGGENGSGVLSLNKALSNSSAKVCHRNSSLTFTGWLSSSWSRCSSLSLSSRRS